MKIKGSSDVQKSLVALGKSMGAKNVRKHMRAGGRVVAKEAKLNASHADVTGETSKTIGVINNKQDKLGVVVGPRRGKQFQKGYVAHILEYGAAPHIIKPKKKSKSGKLAFTFGGNSVVVGEVEHPGIQASPFMRPAWDTKKTEVLARIKEGLKAEMSASFGSKYKKARMR